MEKEINYLFVEEIIMKTKFNRAELKLEFMQSDFDEVKWFIEAKNIPYHRQTREATKWWTKEKKEWKVKIVEKALMRNAEKQAKELSVPLEDLMRWKKALLQLLLHQVWKYVKTSKNDDEYIVDISDAEKIMKMIKTELWEPNTIWANYNLNANKNEELTEDESQALEILFNSKLWRK